MQKNIIYSWEYNAMAPTLGNSPSATTNKIYLSKN